ncbi:Tyrosine recombinase [Streptomyces hygroscopicus subsp. limoneus]|nr:Tyrosine recombinase [Streptomyces hygroscopicus subsp. limoneus]
MGRSPARIRGRWPRRWSAGSPLSGPAARQALHLAANAHRFEGTIVTAAFAHKYLARDGATLYGNPHALLLCREKPENVRRCFRPSPEAISELTSLLAPGDARR